MKKTYMIPAVQVVKVRMTEIIAASIESFSGSGNYASTSAGDVEGGDLTETREYAAWDIWGDAE